MVRVPSTWHDIGGTVRVDVFILVRYIWRRIACSETVGGTWVSGTHARGAMAAHPHGGLDWRMPGYYDEALARWAEFRDIDPAAEVPTATAAKEAASSSATLLKIVSGYAAQQQKAATIRGARA